MTLTVRQQEAVHDVTWREVIGLHGSAGGTCGKRETRNACRIFEGKFVGTYAHDCEGHTLAHSYFGVLGYDTAQSVVREPTFRRDMPFAFSV